jgi:fido (protein-threonine AMPylation protein)
MTQQFAKLRAEKYLVGQSLDDFSAAAAKYVNEINFAHPFVDGNGRTQRSWLRMLADNAGFELRLTERDIKRWNDASARGFKASDHAPMATLLKDRLVLFGQSPHLTCGLPHTPRTHSFAQAVFLPLPIHAARRRAAIGARA